MLGSSKTLLADNEEGSALSLLTCMPDVVHCDLDMIFSLYLVFLIFLFVPSVHWQHGDSSILYEV